MANVMLRAPGTFRSPPTRSCWNWCPSCSRCQDRDRFNCGSICSGRIDEKGQREPHPDDYCRCKEGILQWVRDNGKMLQSHFVTNPFKATFKMQTYDQDEADYDAYVNDMREKYDREDYDPLQFSDGSGSVSSQLGKGGNLG